MFERMQEQEQELELDQASGRDARRIASVRTAARRVERAPSFPRGQS
jgi:hypothetical protein